MPESSQESRGEKTGQQEVHETVRYLADIEMDGNIIPHYWFTHPVFQQARKQRRDAEMARGQANRPNVNAILIYADCIYWYRPKKDGSQKFGADLLQKSYREWMDQFGLTKNQVIAACDFLERAGLIRREFRNIVVRGRAINNVMYVDVTRYPKELPPPPSQHPPSPIAIQEGGYCNPGDSPIAIQETPPLQWGTNTETNENTETNPHIPRRVASRATGDVAPPSPEAQGGGEFHTTPKLADIPDLWELLVGLKLTPDQADEIAHDYSPDHWRRVADHLLTRPRPPEGSAELLATVRRGCDILVAREKAMAA